MAQKQINQKICLLGLYAAGKTSLIRRFVYNLFDEKYLTTIGVNISQKLLPPVMNKKKEWIQYNFIIWDIEGTEKNKKTAANYMAGSHGAIIAADLTRPDLYDQISLIKQEFLKQNPSADVYIAGTKNDLVTKQNQININELEKIAKKLNIEIILTSSKTGENVEELFTELATKRVQNYDAAKIY